MQEQQRVAVENTLPSPQSIVHTYDDHQTPARLASTVHTVIFPPPLPCLLFPSLAPINQKNLSNPAEQICTTRVRLQDGPDTTPSQERHADCQLNLLIQMQSRQSERGMAVLDKAHVSFLASAVPALPLRPTAPPVHISLARVYLREGQSLFWKVMVAGVVYTA